MFSKKNLFILSIFLLTLSSLFAQEIKSSEQDNLSNSLSISDLEKIEKEEFGTISYQITPEMLERSQKFLKANNAPKAPLLGAESGSPVKPSGDAWSSFDKLADGLLKSSNVYLKLVEAFKTKRTKEIDQVIEGKGFDHFAATGVVKMTKGIKADRFGDYIKILKRIVKVPEEHMDAVDGVLQTIEFADKDFWNNYKNAFSIGEQSSAKFVSIYAYANQENNTYDIVYLDVQGTFKLAPDTIVIKKTLMVLGGIWNDDSVEYEKRDKTLTPELMDQVFDFFSILSFHSVGKMLGVNFEFPKF